VLAVDNFFSSHTSRLDHLRSSNRFQLIEHDVSMPLDVPTSLDGIFHLATPADPALFQSHPVEVARAAALGTAEMLELARRHRCRILVASSDAVYGDPLEHPQREESFGRLDPVGPRSAYDEGKRFAESLTMAYHREYRVDTVIARIFHSYGENMPWDGRLIPTYIRNARAGTPLLILGSGEQTRAYCHISDLAEGILALFASTHHGPVNLGSPQEISVRALADLVIQLAGSRSSIQFGPPLEGERKSRCPDISLANRILGWQPGITLEDGLRRTVAYAATLSGDSLQ
jgi:dTDP-glucose 4,6-dehydratase